MNQKTVCVPVNLDALDQIAVRIASGCVANENSGANSPSDIAHYAYEVAYALLVQRERARIRFENASITVVM